MSAHLRRVPVACNRCRKRKTKCLGGAPCRSCLMARQDCIYPTSQKKILIPEDYLLDLEARIKAYESEREGLKPAQSEEVIDADSSTPRSSTPQSLPSSFEPLGSETGKDDIDTNPLIEGTAQLVLNPEGEQQYLGDSSSTSLGLRFRDLIKTFRSGADSEIEDEPPTHKRSSFSVHGRSGQQSSRPAISLPPFDFAKRLYAAQYAYIGTIFAFTDPESFEENLREFYDRAPDFTDRNDRLCYCQTLLVLAFGQMYSVNQWTSHDGPPGFDYFQQALQLLPDIYEQGSVIFVEVLSLVGYFFQNLNLRDVAFLYIGLALRMAISLGLHQEVPDQHLDARTREHRRRAWWSVYSMDRILCVKSGNPLTIGDRDIDVLPPSRLPDELENCPATVLYHYTELSRILGKIMKNVYRRKSETNYSLVTSVQSILKDLSDWHMNLPRRLQVDFTKLDEGISREVISIYLHYNQCINMTARPLVFHVVRSRLQNQDRNINKTDWREGLSRTTIAVIDTCISAARNSIAICATAAKQNAIATYGYMDGEHLFSAAIILVMINIAFPQNGRDRAAMDLALEVMKGVAEKGNSHIKSLHRLLLNLSIPPEKDASQDPRQDLSETAVVQTLQHAPPPEASPAFLYHNDLIAEGYLDLSQSVFQPDETGLMTGMANDADARIWEEGYGIFDVNMDFDWTKWSN